jgi:hypothetical protein
VAIVYLVALTLFASGVNLLWTAYEVRQSHHAWCSTLRLLTATPVPSPADPRENPSRVHEYAFYLNLVDLERRFGC